MMEITTQSFKRCDLVIVNGRVDSATSPQLSEALDAITDDGRFKIVIDLKNVDYMSSAGFRALLVAQRTCRRYNRGEVVLSNVPTRVHEALDLAGFTELFKSFDDETAAVGYF
jgi:anti-sigma B factor antagonist